MKLKSKNSLILSMLLISVLLAIQQSFAGYDLGRQVKIRILSKQTLTHIEISAVNSELLIYEKQTSDCIIREAENTITSVDYINGRLRVVAPSKELYTSSLIFSCADNATGLLAIGNSDTPTRKYHGILRIELIDNSLIIINELPMEQYLYGVIPGEMSPSWDLEALKAQAIVSRTYAYKNLGRHSDEGYDFCDLTHCQSYKGYDAEKPKTNWAVDGTRSLVITYDGDLIDAYYHSTCGGNTSRGDQVWSKNHKPYLVSVDDTLNGDIACKISPHFTWTYQVSRSELYETLAANTKTDPGRFLNYCRVESRYANGRVKYVDIEGEKNRRISGWQFRRVLCKSFGWNSIKSSNFQIEDFGNYFLFYGKGLGHGVGMCQYGALARARVGFSAEEILTFYFPGTKVTAMIY